MGGPDPARTAVGAASYRQAHALLPPRTAATDPGSSCGTVVQAHERRSPGARACVWARGPQELPRAVCTSEERMAVRGSLRSLCGRASSSEVSVAIPGHPSLKPARAK